MRFRRKDAGRKPELNLASMIDATFLLLAFFIFTIGQGQDESRLSPNLRVQQGTDVADDLEPQVLEVVLRIGSLQPREEGPRRRLRPPRAGGAGGSAVRDE